MKALDDHDLALLRADIMNLKNCVECFGDGSVKTRQAELRLIDFVDGLLAAEKATDTPLKIDGGVMAHRYRHQID